MVKDWVNSKEYFITYSISINAAQQCGVVTYQEVAQACGLPTSGNYMSSTVGNLLGEVSRNELAHGRPFLSAIAVGVNGKPGDGFYDWAKKLGSMKDDQDEEAFLTEESRRVYEAWRVTYRVSKVK